MESRQSLIRSGTVASGKIASGLVVEVFHPVPRFNLCEPSIDTNLIRLGSLEWLETFFPGHIRPDVERYRRAIYSPHALALG